MSVTQKEIPTIKTILGEPLSEGEVGTFFDGKEREYLRRLERGKNIYLRRGRITVAAIF